VIRESWRGAGRAAALLASLAVLVVGVATPANAQTRDEHCVILLDDDDAATAVCADTVEAADAVFTERTGLTRVESADAVGPLVVYSLATLYTDAGYGGSSYTFTRSSACNGVTLSSVANLGSIGMNDAVSSFFTYSSCTVRLFVDASYGGSSYGWATSQSSLPSFNDVASSARVR
jgi:hypothetical protein